MFYDGFITQKNENKIYSKKALKQRGWTDAMIKHFAPQPIRFEINPNYRSAAEVPVYNEKEIIKIEESDIFKEYINKNKKRKEGAKKAVLTRKERTIDQTLELINNIKPPKRLDINHLIRQAIRNFKEYQQYTGEYYSEDPREFFVCKRTLCNYIRHNMMPNYDEECWNSYGKVGSCEAYEMYKKAIMESIWSVYPELRYNLYSETDGNSKPNI